MFGLLSPMLGRISFCYTLIMITRAHQGMKTWPIWVVIALQVALHVVALTVFYAQCGSHLDVYWNVAIQHQYRQYCYSPEIQTKYGYFLGSFNTVTDALLAIYPAVLIEQTRLSRRAKVGLWFLLCLSAM